MQKKQPARPQSPAPSKNKPISDSTNPGIGTLAPAAGLYLVIAILFGPVVIGGMALSTSPDMIAAAGMIAEAERQLGEGHFPLWNPTVFCGMPLFASLQYANFVYPAEYPIKLLSYIFGGGTYRVWLFHYLLAGLFVFLLARHLGAGRWAAWIAGAAYALSPQLIVLADVGHGSKLMGMVWLPLVWLTLDRLRQKPSPGRAAALGAVFAIEILSLHPQVAAYGGLLMVLYLIYHLFGAISGGRAVIGLKTVGYWLGAMLLSLAVSAILWVSVLDYARFSIRGAAASGAVGGGVTWDYSTGWSFHPIESLTYLFPKFFGFAGNTYWGTVGTPDGSPFTQNPMFFGVAVVIFAAAALFLAPKTKWGFPLTLGLFAWVLSFGRYLPILYAPLFYGLPMFNKFRAPVMGQVLLLLAAVILAALGLQNLIERTRQDKSPQRLVRAAWYIAGGATFLALVALMGEGLFNSIYRSIAEAVGIKARPEAVAAAMAPARLDVIRSLALATVIVGAAALFLKRKLPQVIFFVVVTAILLLDLMPIDRKLVQFVPESQRDLLFQPEKAAIFLRRDNDKFRVHPLDKNYPAIYWQRQLGLQANINPSNWLGLFGIEATTGYFGAKPAAYQQFMDITGMDANPPYSWLIAYGNPHLLDWMNVRYLLTTIPLNNLFDEIERQTGEAPLRPAGQYQLVFMPRDIQPGAGAFIYKNPGELPRARLLGKYRVIPELEATFREMTQGAWNPTVETILDREPELAPEAGGVHSLRIIQYKPWRLEIDAESSVPKLLLLADNYYPSGWGATIDGRPTDILRADGVYRAVALPAGEHKVAFTFRPKWFYIGLWISLVSAAVLLIWLIGWIMKNNKFLVR